MYYISATFERLGVAAQPYTTTTKMGQEQNNKSPRTHNGVMSQQNRKEKVVLIVGACGLDRLLSVSTYPIADAKVRTKTYHEQGGGNAANTASAMGRLLDASFLQAHRTSTIRIKLLTKIGPDDVGRQLIDELHEFGVDTSSPLFRTSAPGTTTSFATVIVSELEHTRTCFHTPGSCGELTVEDVQSVDLNEVFEHVVHLHSDARHTAASLYLVHEAKSRGIPVSVDIEKDRNTKDLDQLFELTDLLFTNTTIHFGAFLQRLEKEHQILDRRMPLQQATVSTPITTTTTSLDAETSLYADSLAPIAFYHRWYSPCDKTVIVTQGGAGSLHFHADFAKKEEDESGNPPSNDIQIILSEEDSKNIIHVHHKYTEVWDGGEQKSSEQRQQQTPLRSGNRTSFDTVHYKVHQSGVLIDLNIVDTTGAGDAFIGGFLLVKIGAGSECAVEDAVPLALNFASWVAGKKIEGPGARHSLPRGAEVDQLLGMTIPEIKDKLTQTLTPFSCYK